MFEVAVLKPYDQSKDQESWPLLELTDATVYKYRLRGEDTVVDLLNVQGTGPYRIKGKLSKIPAGQEDIILPGRGTRIYEEEMTLTRVTTYSIEQFEDGTIKIWALGRSGWYSIRPSVEYKPYFKTMLEKGRLWCFLQDLYCDKYQGQGKAISGSVNDLYISYSRRGIGCSSARAAAKLFDKHRQYLLFEMCGVRADVEMWARTPLFRAWMKDHKGEIDEVRKSMSCANVHEDREDTLPAVKEETPTPTPSNISARKPRVHSRSLIYKAWRVIHQYIMDKGLQPTEITKDQIIGITRKKFVFSSLDHAARALEAKAPEILLLMEYPPVTMIYPPGWINTPAYKQFGDVKEQKTDAAEHQWKFIIRRGQDDPDIEATSPRSGMIVKAPALPPTGARNKIPSTPAGGSDEDSESSEDENPRGRKCRSAKGKSVLRPARTPAPPPGGQSPSESVDRDGEPVPDDAPAAFSLARKRDQVDDADSTPVAKRPCTRGTNEQPLTATSPGLSAFSTTTTTATTTTTIIAAKPPASTKRPKTTGANQPGGHWECEIAGCKHSILDANEPGNLLLIEQHYEEHGKVMKQAMEAIGGEILPSRPRHHVDNLLAKIEAMAQKWAMSKPAPLTSSEMGLPQQSGSDASPGL